MNSRNFSEGFDTLLSSYAYIAPTGSTDNPVSIEVDEYEKSLFLTAAQEEIVLGLYNGRNVLGEGFEETEELRRYLSPLVEMTMLKATTGKSGITLGMDSHHKFFTLPDDAWFIVYEAVKTSKGGCKGNSDQIVDVYPIRHDEYHKIKRNPFRGVNSRRAFRLDLADGVIEIISDYSDIEYYYVRYLRRPKPIILANLDGTNIEDYIYGGDVTPTYEPIGTFEVYGDNCCELPESLHQKILERAVVMALQSKGQYSNKQDSK